jgi:hypothetical protein
MFIGKANVRFIEGANVGVCLQILMLKMICSY